MIIWENESVTLFQSALYKTLSAVIRTKDMTLIVDPCWLPGEVAEIRAYVERHALGLPWYLLFTHSDFDHILGYGAFPEAEVIASKALADLDLARRERIVEEIRSFDDDYYLERGYDAAYPLVDHPVVHDGQVMQAGSTRLCFYLSPGHTEDGLFTVVEPLGVLLAGDYLSDVEFPFIYYSSYSYEESLGKLNGIMEEHSIRLLVPGHGGFTWEPEEIRRRQMKDLAYIKTMRHLTAEGDEQGMEQLIHGCPFPRNMRKAHDSNRLKFRKERIQKLPGNSVEK